MSDQGVETGGEQGGAGSRLLRWSLGVGVVLALIAVGWFVVRTPLILGHFAGPVIADQAQARGIDLQVESIGGAGLVAARMYGVDGAFVEGTSRVEFSANRVDVVPDVAESLRRRQPVIDRVVVGRAEVSVSAVSKPEASEPLTASSASDRRARWHHGGVGLEVGEVTVDAPGVGSDIEFAPLGAIVDPDDLRVEQLDAGVRVHGWEFDVRTDDGRIIAVFDAGAMDDALDVGFVDVEFDALFVDQRELEKMVRTGDVDVLELGIEGLSVAFGDATTASIRADESFVSGDSAGARWRASRAEVDELGEGYELTDVELAYRADAPGFSFVGRLDDEEGGGVDFEGLWHLPTSLVDINAWMSSVRWDGRLPGELFGEPPVESMRVDGAIHAEFDIVHQLVSADVEAGVSNLVVQEGIVAPRPVTFERFEVGMPVVLDLTGRAFSVTGGAVRPEGISPLELDARLVETARSVAFDARLRADGIDAGSLPEKLPPELVGVVDQSTLKGEFGFQVAASGDTSRPDSLLFEVELVGDVEVIDEAAWWADDDGEEGVRLYSADDGEIQLMVEGSHQKLQALPEYIPAAVLAAEDTAFFEHDGIDWSGMRMAMVDNLEEQRLVRGGSTITQQVAKNLFLSHDRTASRKIQEAYLTWRLEEALEKEEILELYLNVVEWGADVRGLPAAADHYFDAAPAELEPLEVVLLASILPSPIRFGGAVQAGYLPSSRADKMRRVLENMRFLEDLSWAAYAEAIEQLDEGRVGRRNFEICRDDDTAPPEADDCDEIELETRDGREATFQQRETAAAVGGMQWKPLTH